MGGVAATVAVMGVIDADGFRLDAAVLVLALATAVAEGISRDLQAGDTGVTLSLLEAAVVVDVLLLGPAEGMAAVLLGVVVQHGFRRLAPLKILFNLGQHAVGTSVVVVLVALAPGGGTIGLGRVLAVVVAMPLSRVISAHALAGVFARLEADGLREKVAERPMELVASTLGNSSIGVIAAALWTSHPTLVWVVAAPAAALYLSYGSSYRIEELLTHARLERDRLDRIVGGVREGIILLDADGRVQVWNAAMATMLGVAPEHAAGRHVNAVLEPSSDAGTPLDLLLGLDGPDATDGVVREGRVADVTGDVVPARFALTPVEDGDGRHTGVVMLVHDLRREREAAALKEDFVARVSHELRTPLSPLRGYAQALRRAGDRVPETKRAEILDQMVERVGHMSKLVDDLLLVSQIGSGRVDPAGEMDLAEVDVAELVPRLAAWLGAEHVRDHTIEVVGTDEPVMARCDQMRTGQILTNLLTNACKYSDPGTPVTVRVRRSAGQVEVVVEDRGAGIPSDKLDAIFERFERLDDPQRMQVGGIGLGLYISRHLAEAMDGSLTVHSTVGVGTAFTLTLPASERERQHADAGAGSPSADRTLRRVHPSGCVEMMRDATLDHA